MLEALHDSNTMLVRPAPGNRNGRVLALNEEKLPGFGRRGFGFFGIHNDRNESIASFDDPVYYVDKPRADLRRAVLCTTLSVLAKSAAALLVSRHLADLRSNWNIVCVPYVGDATGADLGCLAKRGRQLCPSRRRHDRVRTSKYDKPV